MASISAPSEIWHCSLKTPGIDYEQRPDDLYPEVIWDVVDLLINFSGNYGYPGL
jgi:hypothetical protein